MSAPVRIEAEAWTDLRFATLARLLGLADADHALIRTARLWSWQAEHPALSVDADTIESVLGAGGPAAMVRAKLADETPTGYRLRGVSTPSATLSRMRTYAITDAGNRAIKIGRSSDVGRRMAELQTAHPGNLVLYGAIDGDLEQVIHAYLDAIGKRLRGEWFAFDVETIEILAAHGIGKAGR